MRAASNGFFVGLLAILLWAGRALAADDVYPAGVTVGPYAGWTRSISINNGETLLVIVPGAGGRALRYALNNENIFFLSPDLDGKTLADLNGRGAHGGHQIDLGPELGKIPDHPELWWGDYSWHVPGPYSVEVTSKADPVTGVRITKSFVMDPDNGELGITQTMENTTTNPVKYCLWDRTLCLNDGFAVIPLNRKSCFANRWALRVKDAKGDWQYDGGAKAPEQVHVVMDHLVVRCQGPATKVGADNLTGWIAYVRGRLMYVKYFPCFPKGSYTDGGCSAEVYFDQGVAELEPLSPEVELKPNETYEFPEKWTLLELDEPVTTPEQAVRATQRIPASPFK